MDQRLKTDEVRVPLPRRYADGHALARRSIHRTEPRQPLAAAHRFASNAPRIQPERAALAPEHHAPQSHDGPDEGLVDPHQEPANVEPPVSDEMAANLKAIAAALEAAPAWTPAAAREDEAEELRGRPRPAFVDRAVDSARIEMGRLMAQNRMKYDAPQTVRALDPRQSWSEPIHSTHHPASEVAATLEPPTPTEQALASAGAEPETGRHEGRTPLRRPVAAQKPLTSGSTRNDVNASLDNLSRTILSDQPRTLEDLVGEMMRPMLCDWLNTHLPEIVEREVRQEIERVRRHTR